MRTKNERSVGVESKRTLTERTTNATGRKTSPMKTKSALSWFGSDSEVASELAAMLDHCHHVSIPFVGGASIIPHLKARAILANDLHNAAINFYKFASGRFGLDQQAALFRKCDATLSHPQELWQAGEYMRERCLQGSLNHAWAFWVQCWLGRKGKGGCKGKVSMPSVRYTAGGGTNASRIKSAANDLQAWAAHFQRCEWTSEDFRVFLSRLADNVDCGIYCDPPWVGAGDSYLHTFSEQDHRDLADCLDRFDHSTVVVRYGDHPLIQELYPLSKWLWTRAESRTQSNGKTPEVWISKP